MPSAAPANVTAEILSLRLTNRPIAVSSWRCASSNVVIVFSANSDLQSALYDDTDEKRSMVRGNLFTECWTKQPIFTQLHVDRLLYSAPRRPERLTKL